MIEVWNIYLKNKTKNYKTPTSHNWVVDPIVHSVSTGTGTVFVTCIPWVLFGGLDECRRVRGTSKTPWDQDFQVRKKDSCRMLALVLRWSALKCQTVGCNWNLCYRIICWKLLCEWSSFGLSLGMQSIWLWEIIHHQHMWDKRADASYLCGWASWCLVNMPGGNILWYGGIWVKSMASPNLFERFESMYW